MLKLNKEVPIEDLIGRQVNFWESKHRVIPGNIDFKPCITISKEPGSRAVPLAKNLAETLDWKIFDKEIVEYIATNANVRKEIVERFDERTRREMDNMMATLLDSHTLSHESYYKFLAKTILSIGRHGSSIILGRGANYILPSTQALKIKIVESMASRIQNLIHEGINRSQAEKLIKRQSQERKAFLGKFFGNMDDEIYSYDLIINISLMSVNTAQKIIQNAYAAKFEKEL